CLKALEKQPENRFATAKAFADELWRWLHDEPLTIRPVAWWERLWRWTRRNPMVAGLVAAVMLLMVGINRAAGWAATSRDRELHVQKPKRIRTSARHIGWRNEAGEEVRRAAAIYRHDENHRLWKEATAVLAGIDARQVKWFEAKKDYEHDASSVAFAPDG